QLRATCERLLERFRQPVLVEGYLPGREFTVGIIGTGAEATAIGVLEVLLGGQAEPEIYSYVNKQDYAARVGYRLAGGPISGRAQFDRFRRSATLGARCVRIRRPCRRRRLRTASRADRHRSQHTPTRWPGAWAVGGCGGRRPRAGRTGRRKPFRRRARHAGR